MPFSRPEKKPIIAILVKRTVLFFFFLCILAVYLYGIGTAQEFMDETQLMLLHLLVILGLSLNVSAIYGIFLNFWFVFHHRKYRFFGGLGMYIALALFGITVAALAALILVAARGNKI